MSRVQTFIPQLVRRRSGCATVLDAGRTGTGPPTVILCMLANVVCSRLSALAFDAS
jgi:hypothetical protein